MCCRIGVFGMLMTYLLPLNPAEAPLGILSCTLPLAVVIVSSHDRTTQGRGHDKVINEYHR